MKVRVMAEDGTVHEVMGYVIGMAEGGEAQILVASAAKGFQVQEREPKPAPKVIPVAGRIIPSGLN
jgi:hypothetical protein